MLLSLDFRVVHLGRSTFPFVLKLLALYTDPNTTLPFLFTISSLSVNFLTSVPRAVLLNHGDRDDVIMATEMITSGVPLDEPVLQSRLSYLASEERKVLQGGKLPISESFYLMGTADPTGTLNHNQVCVIL